MSIKSALKVCGYQYAIGYGYLEDVGVSDKESHVQLAVSVINCANTQASRDSQSQDKGVIITL